MAPVKYTSASWETKFLGEPLAELSDDHLPTLGELFRHFYYHRKVLPHNERHRKVAIIVVKRCIEIWDKFGIPTALAQNLTAIFLKLLKLFTYMPYGTEEGSSARRRKELLWRKKLTLVFWATAKDAVKKCDRKNKRLLLAIKKKADEFERMERNISTKGKLNEEEVAAVLGVKKPVMEKRATLKRKAVSAENAERAAKECKLSRQSEAVTSAVTSSDNLKKPKLEPFCSLTDRRLTDAEIARSDSPVMVKEEINIDWDENDNSKLRKYKMALFLVDYITRITNRQ